jgi:hypothetical protein
MSTPIVKYRLTPYQRTAAALATENAIPLQGERVRETDTGREKTGDGSTHYNDLPYNEALVEYANQAAFTGTGKPGKIYVALDTGDSFRWSGSAYVRISDRVTASGITDSGAVGRSVVQAATQAAARIATDSGMAQRARYGARTVVDGDSITIRPGTVSTWNSSPGGWSMEMARLSNGRIDLLYNAGVSSTGITTRISNFPTKVAPYTPETVLLANGTNDMSIMTLSQYLTYLGQYYDLVRGIGAQLILGGIYPKNVDVDKASSWNAGIVDWAKTRGVLVIPFWELGDPTTGAWPSGWSTDGVHPDYDSLAFPAIGKFAWQAVQRAYTEPVAASARYATDPGALLTCFFTDLTATITGAATITGIVSTTGTLAAGDYTYRVVAGNHYGQVSGVADSTITLSASTGATITSGASGSYTTRRVFRQSPGDTTFYYIGNINVAGTQTFTDNGIANGYAYRAGDTTRYPTGMITGGWQDAQTLAYGPPVRDGASEGIRGNIFRGARCEGSAVYRSDRFLITGLTAGQVVTVSVKCKGANTAGQDALQMRYFNPAGDTQIDVVALGATRFGTDWGLIYGRTTVPTGSDRVYVCLEGTATNPFSDWAELRVF